jgi:hypothetical protein
MRQGMVCRIVCIPHTVTQYHPSTISRGVLPQLPPLLYCVYFPRHPSWVRRNAVQDFQCIEVYASDFRFNASEVVGGRHAADGPQPTAAATQRHACGGAWPWGEKARCRIEPLSRRLGSIRLKKGPSQAKKGCLIWEVVGGRIRKGDSPPVPPQ